MDGHTAMSIALGTGVEEFLDALRGSVRTTGARHRHEIGADARAGLRRQAGEGVDDLFGGALAVESAGVAHDAEHLRRAARSPAPQTAPSPSP